MTIANATIRDNAWDAIYTLINDNKATIGINYIYGVEPNWQTAKFPCIVIEPFDIDPSTDKSFDQTPTRKRMMDVVVKIYSKKSSENDSITDAFTNLFESTVITDFHSKNYVDGGVQPIIVNNQPMFFRPINLTGLKR